MTAEVGSKAETPPATLRPTSPGGEAWLASAPVKCLDDGFVRLVDYFGNDDAIAQAARTSYGTGTRRVSSDRALIRYLMRHRHTTPFEMCELKFHVRTPMDVWRQWIRHRTASVNEYSTRYSEAIDSAHRTEPGAWRRQSTVNRQGSGNTLDPGLGASFTEQETELQKMARRVYEGRIAAGVAREQARKDLPLSTYTEAYWKMDLHNLFHFLSLRLDSHAQYEIRVFAQVIARITKDVFPVAYEAFEDYLLNRLVLSDPETKFIMTLADRVNGYEATQCAANAFFGATMDATNCREANECMEKLVRLGLVPE